MKNMKVSYLKFPMLNGVAEVPSGTIGGDLCAELTAAAGDTGKLLSGREAVFSGESSIPFRFPWVYHKKTRSAHRADRFFYE